MPAKRTEVIVIGGGISGTTAAYELARAGARVTLLERGELASMASGWTLAGVRQSGRHPSELPLAMAAVARWKRLSGELGADLEYRQDGNLRLARTVDEIPVAEELVAEQRRLGLDLTFLPDNRAVREVAPAIAETVLAASFCPSDGHANPTATVRAFAAAAVRHGATLKTATTVAGIETLGGRVEGVYTDDGPMVADAVVVAASVYSGLLCAPLGIELSLRVARVAVVQTVPRPPLIQQVLGVANGDFAGRQEVNGRLRFTGGGEIWPHSLDALAAGNDAVQPRTREVMAALKRAIAVVPALADAGVARVWGGLLDMTPDALPIIERVPEIEGLVVAAGFSGHGFCLGPVTGEILRDLVMRGSTAHSIAGFARNRFARRSDVAAATLHG